MAISSLALKFLSRLRVRSISTVMGVQGSSKVFFSTGSLNSGDATDNEGADGELEIDDDDFLPERPELQLQDVDPRKGWNFRGAHRAIICRNVGQAAIQRILSNGRTVTIFTVGTGVHNPMLGAYGVQQLGKKFMLKVILKQEYNGSINGDIKSIPEICVCPHGRVRLIKAGESISKISIDELREGLL